MMLDTPRLVLRDFTPDDAAALHAIESDPAVTRYMSFDPQSPEQTQAYIAGAVGQQIEDPRLVYDLAIVPRGASALVGRCGLGIHRPEHFEGELWYLLAPHSQRQGIASEAVRAMLDFAFGPLGLHRVFADCDPRNAASCRLIERLGFRLEGRLRENYRLRGEWCDTHLYAMLSHEWPPGAPAPG
ncbi:MAG: GNAT family N-acetyltransferase [Phycisphaerales bacterium]|nr:GNAT family N-acetyltransferase [Phycisphaerales bacterium]